MANATVVQQLPLSYIEEYCGNALVNVAIAFTVIEAVFVSLRFLARHIGSVKYAADDILVVIGLVLCLGINGVAIAMVQYSGVGHHEIVVYQKNPLNIVLWAKFLVVESFLYLVVVAVPKLAILVIYLRVFPGKAVRRWCYGIGSIMVLYVVVVCLVAGFACRPLAYFWDKTIDGTCVDIKALYQWASFPNIVTDVAMLILPLPLIWRLKLTTHVKIGLSFTFLTGSLGLIASCLRFAEFAQVNPLADGTWASVTLMIWTIIEPGSYLIAACLPTLRPLLIKVRETGRESLRKGSFLTSSKRGSDATTVEEMTSRRNTEINRNTVISVERSPAEDVEKSFGLANSTYNFQASSAMVCTGK